MALFNFRKKQKVVPIVDDFELLHHHGLEYEKVMDQYFETSMQIDNLASVLYNLKIKEGPRMDELIALCYKHIEEWKKAKSMWTKFGQPLPAVCNGYKRLAIIYDQQKKYNECLKVCIEAIDEGLHKGNYSARIARMLKKLEIKDISPYEKYLF